MPGTLRASHPLLAALAVGVITGCASMQPTPIMPTYPAQIGGRSGVTAEQDATCRQQAYLAAEQTKQQNVNKEVASTMIGAVAGAVVGHAVSDRGPGGPGPRGPGPGGPGPGGPRPGPGPSSGPNLTGAGAVAGAATGAAVSQGMLQDTQQVYDINYNNCIAAYINANAQGYSRSNRRW